MTTKPPTAQGISRLLAKAGFERSVSHTTRIKGWHDWNEGFQVTRGHGSHDGDVIVQLRMDKWARGEAAGARRAAETERYAEAIRAAGYTVTVDEKSVSRLIVTAGEDQVTTTTRKLAIDWDHVLILDGPLEDEDEDGYRREQADYDAGNED